MNVNLRRDRYGCIDFHALARSARERNYHASVALIPLDASRVGREAATIFRDNPQNLSILIHGNNHINFELARDYPAAEQLAILAEARRRMLGLANRSSPARLHGRRTALWCASQQLSPGIDCAWLRSCTLYRSPLREIQSHHRRVSHVRVARSRIPPGGARDDSAHSRDGWL